MDIVARPADRYARFLGVGSHRGSRVVTNDEMCTMLDSTPEWIEDRTGIVERRWSTDEESTEFMALAAARKALAQARVEPSQIGAIILSTVSHLRQTPALATTLAHKLGTDHAAAWDISAACAGFCHAVGQADALVRTRTADYVLVIGAEKLSEQLDVTDRGIGFLLADAAGAAVIGPSETPGIGPVIWGSEGEHAAVIQSDLTWNEAMATGTWPTIRMEGRKVFKWAISAVADHAAEAIRAAGLTPDEIDCFIPHQANNRIIDSMLRHLTLGENVKVARDIRRLGNTSSASIPLAMESMLASGEAHSGDKALIIGFGAGLVYAGQVVTLP